MAAGMALIFQPEAPIDWQWISFEGDDAEDFLQRLSTANAKALPIGRGTTACFLNAQGKIQAYFWLWRVGPKEFVFEFDAGPSGDWKKRLLEFIDHHTFGEKFSLTDRST